MEQNFAAPGVEEFVTRAPQVVARAPSSASHSVPRTVPGAIGEVERQTSQAVGAAITGIHAVARSEREAEAKMRGIQGTLNVATLPLLLAIPLGFVANWFKPGRTKTVLTAGSTSLSEALHVPTRDVFQMPAKYLSSVAESATASNLGGWAAKATSAATRLESQGNRMTSFFAGFKDTALVRSMPAAVKSLAVKAGGLPFFASLMIVSTAVGISATLFGSRAERKETKQAYDTLMADLGGDKNSAFAQAIKGNFVQKKKQGLLKSGLELTSDVVGGAVMMKPSYVGFGAIAGPMLPQICAGFVPENPTLGGYIAYKKAEAGQLTLDTEAKVMIIKHLAALKPSVAAHGGEYNRLNHAFATECVTRGMKIQEVVQLLNNDGEFNKFAAEIKAKHSTPQSPQPSVGEAKASVKPVAAEKTVLHPEAANAPKLQISGDKQHVGMMAQGPAKARVN